MARPTLPDHERRSRGMRFAVTDIEGVELEQVAASYGLRLSEFFRSRVLGHRLPVAAVNQQQQAEATTALLRLGVNLNQIAKVVNAGRDVPDARLSDLLTRIHSTMDMLDESGGDRARSQL